MPILRVCIATVLAAVLAACETTPQRTEVAVPKPDPTRSAMNNANSAYRNGDDAVALALYMPLARAGHRDAQIRVADIYSRNKGVPVNHGESCNWWEAAARQNDANAANNIGRCFESGNGRGQSHTDAAFSEG